MSLKLAPLPPKNKQTNETKKQSQKNLLTILQEPLEDFVDSSSIVLIERNEVRQSHTAELLPCQSIVGLSPEEGAIEVFGVGEGEDPVENLSSLPVLRVCVHPAGESPGVAALRIQVCARKNTQSIVKHLSYFCVAFSLPLCLSVCLSLFLSLSLPTPTPHYI